MVFGILNMAVVLALLQCDASFSMTMPDGMTLVSSGENYQLFRISANRFVYAIEMDDADDEGNGDRSSGGTATSFSFSGKGITMGSSSTSNTLTVGHSAVLGGDIEFKSAFEITLPAVDPDYYRFESASFVVSKLNGSLSSIHCYSVDDVSYANLNGLSSPTTTFLSTSTLDSGQFAFNVTAAVGAAYSALESSIVILLAGNVANQIANLANSGSAQRPRLYVEYSNYGSAAPFEYPESLYPDPVFDTNVNCLMYALNAMYRQIPNWADIDPELSLALGTNVVTQSNLSTAVYDILDTKGFTVRLLSDYDSQILAVERRIAFRVALDHYRYDGGFHFFKQCSLGDWACKAGTEGSYGCYEGEEAILDNSVWTGYTSPTVYLAVID